MAMGAFDEAWLLLKQLGQEANENAPYGLSQEDMRMAADPNYGELPFSPERINAMMAAGLDPSMAMGRRMKPASYYADKPDEYYDDVESGALTPEMSSQLYSDMAHGDSNQQVTAAPSAPAPQLTPEMMNRLMQMRQQQ